jgi:hypothetical protein
MKTLALLAAALAISLTCAGTASARGYDDGPVTETRTSTPRPALCAVVQLITEAIMLDLPQWCRSRSR